MPSVRSFLESHSPLPVSPGSQEGLVVIETDDITELEEIVGREIVVVEVDEDHVELSFERLQQLAQEAHNIIHQPTTGAEDLLHRIFGPDEDESDNPSIEPGYDQTQLRLTSMSFASQIIAVKIQAGSGLDSLDHKTSDVVDQAEAIYKFLKGDA